MKNIFTVKGKKKQKMKKDEIKKLSESENFSVAGFKEFISTSLFNKVGAALAYKKQAMAQNLLKPDNKK